MGPRLTQEELYRHNINGLHNRFKAMLPFIDEIKQPILDYGERNPLVELLEKSLGCPIDSTDLIDLDRHPTPSAGTVFCFEVLEHVYNPLFLLENIKAELLYLSTPIQFPKFLKGHHHFHEIPDNRMNWLLKESGWSIAKMKRITIAGNITDHLHGIRPFLRYFQKTRIYKLERS